MKNPFLIIEWFHSYLLLFNSKKVALSLIRVENFFFLIVRKGYQKSGILRTLISFLVHTFFLFLKLLSSFKHTSPFIFITWVSISNKLILLFNTLVLFSHTLHPLSSHFHLFPTHFPLGFNTLLHIFTCFPFFLRHVCCFLRIGKRKANGLIFKNLTAGITISL
jgi:hypothetical protein